KVGDYATVGVAAIAILEGNSIRWAGLGITGVSEIPYAAEEAEAVLVGNAPAAQAPPVADVRGPVDYKRAMVTELSIRALRSAVERGLAYAQETHPRRTTPH